MTCTCSARNLPAQPCVGPGIRSLVVEYASVADASDLAVEGLLPRLDCGPQLERLAEDAVDGTLAGNEEFCLAERLHFLNEWLKFSQSDSALAAMRWSCLAASGNSTLEDRDRYTLRLWRLVVTEHVTAGLLKAYAERFWCSWSFYERHFFGWFLGRFALGAARSLFPRARFATALPALVLVSVTALAVLLVGWGGFTLLVTLAFSFACALLLAGLWALSRLPFHAFAASLIPRFGVTVGIGYLFQLATPALTGLAQAQQRTWKLWLVTAALLVGVFAYTMLHIERRVFPPLRFRGCARRALEVTGLAVAYAVAGLVVVGPVLFHPSFPAAGVVHDTAGAPLAAQLAVSAAIALALGVILQLAWEREPLTDPL